jgi:serine/threonine protein kinase
MASHATLIFKNIFAVFGLTIPRFRRSNVVQDDVEHSGGWQESLEDVDESPYGDRNRAARVTPKFPIGDTITHGKFYPEWDHIKMIGQGGDGQVHGYRNVTQKGTYIAVKLPLFKARKGLEQEIKNMRLLGRHDHVLELLGVVDEWVPYGSAMILPWCKLGSLTAYRESWRDQQWHEGQPARVSEITMYKLFRDMVLALNYLHHELEMCYVHGDFKPGNILAVMDPGDSDHYRIPEEPIFKLADFSRMTPWPTPPGEQPKEFVGTPEFAPPLIEQIAPIHTSADIWALGVTLQFMALGHWPTESREAFVRRRKAEGRSFPVTNEEWREDHWRHQIPTVFRPLHVPVKVLQDNYDFGWNMPGYQPYGVRLSNWYAKLWKPVGDRPRASYLVAKAIPEMDSKVKRLKLQRLKELSQDE